MKKTLRMMARGALAAACMLLSAGLANNTQAQSTVTVGTGTSTASALPISSCWGYSYTQQIYPAADIQAAGGFNGSISKLRFYFDESTDAGGATSNSNNWTIYLGNTTQSQFATTTSWIPLSSLTQVFSGTVTFPAAGNWMEITLATPFTWDGTSNLVVAIDENQTDYNCSIYWRYTNTGTTNSSIYYRSDVTNPNPASPPSASGRNTYYPNIQLDLTSATACSGTPAATITSSITTGSVCAGTPFTLFGAPSGLSGLTYQFQSSTDGTTWDALGTASPTASYVVPSQTVPSQYRVIVTCAGGGTDTSAAISIAQSPFLNCYCTSTANNTADEDIFNVTFGSLNNSSTCATTGTGASSVLNQYSDYRSGAGAPAVPDIPRGVSLPFSVEVGTCGTSSYNNAVKIFIDWNHNGLFTDPGEEVYAATAATLGAHMESGAITVPSDALLGNTVMRVVNVETSTISSITPCGNYGYGETEDYLINVINPAPCSGTPAASITSTVSGPVCPATPFTLAAAPNGLTGLTYLFQSSTDGTTWTDLAAASDMPSYNIASQSATTEYRVIVACAAGSTDTSAAITVAQNPPYNCYCTDNLGGASGNSIDTVVIVGTTLDNASPGTAPGYYTAYPASGSTTATLYKGGTYTLHTAFSSASIASLWIDYNQNGVFEPGEHTQLTTSGSNATVSITIPGSALSGQTGMRIRTRGTGNDNGPGDACTSFGSGETEDYIITIADAPLCSGTPAPGATYAAGDTTICVGNAVLLGVENHPLVSGLSYQWYASTDGGITWDAIAGATDSTFSAAPEVYTTYRALVTCTGSGDTASSTPISIAFNTNIDSVIAGSVCDSGAVTLTVMAASGTLISWYDTPTGTVALDTGLSFTTPVLTATTTYYAAPSATIMDNATIGAGTNTTSSTDLTSPFETWYGNYKHQYLVLASELAAAGLQPGQLTSLSFDVLGTYGASTYTTLNNFTVSIMGTTATALTSTFVTGTSVVWTGNYTPVTGTNTFTFSTPFVWDGTSNIIIQTCYNNDNSGGSSGGGKVAYDNTSFVSHAYYRVDGTATAVCATADATNTQNKRPKMMLGYEATCMGPRVPVTATVGTPVSVDLGPDTSICSGDLLTLDAGNPGATYAWSTGATTQTIDADAAGTYSVTVSSGACSASDTLVIDEIAAPVAGPIVIVDNMPSYDFSAPATTGGLTYSWDFGDGTTATTETASHTYTANGTYTVTFTVTNACGQSGSTTASVTVSGVRVGSVAGQPSSVQVYPNPSRGLTVVEAQGAVISSVEVMDNLGRMVLRSQPDAAKAVIDVKGMAQGIYTLRIQTNKGISTVKLVVKD